jgi:hypothetical protein
MNITKLAERLPELDTLAQKLADAKLEYQAGIEAVAEQTGIPAKTLRQYVNDRGKDKTKDRARGAVEYLDLFEGMGETLDEPGDDAEKVRRAAQRLKDTGMKITVSDGGRRH